MTEATEKTQRYRGCVLTAKGWRKLQAQIQALEVQTRMRQTAKTIAERVQLNHPEGIHPMTVRKVLKGVGGVDRSSIKRIFQALKLELEQDDCVHAKLCPPPGIIEQPAQLAQIHSRQNWGEAVDVSSFYGRKDELAQLKQRIVSERCRLITLLGMGGIGKTALSVKLATEVQDEFEYVIWKSIRHAPTLQETLINILQFLSQPSGSQMELPASVEGLTARLIEQFKQHRCLLLLDQLETILQSLSLAGYYREGYEPYGDLLKVLAEVPHQSCLVLTSREKPREIGVMEGKTVQSIYLDGLKLADSQQLIHDLGNFTGLENEWRLITAHYAGNPLALKIVAARTRDYLNSDLSECLEELRKGRLVFSDLRNLMGRQFNRLSVLEQEILVQLAVYRDWVSLSHLREDLPSPVLQQSLLDVLDSLRGRSLLQKQGGHFRLQPFVSEYVKEYGVKADNSSTPFRVKVA
ncbi:MAG: NB-ARC domain-containing protein [Pseudanabaenales cyanobacterium]|nr:NB-ARC domain-containing protein [Pseudanabaenales cyanobacterium]